MAKYDGSRFQACFDDTLFGSCAECTFRIPLYTVVIWKAFSHWNLKGPLLASRWELITPRAKHMKRES